jgi:hypothetical protein
MEGMQLDIVHSIIADFEDIRCFQNALIVLHVQLSEFIKEIHVMASF